MLTFVANSPFVGFVLPLVLMVMLVSLGMARHAKSSAPAVSLATSSMPAVARIEVGDTVRVYGPASGRDLGLRKVDEIRNGRLFFASPNLLARRSSRHLIEVVPVQ